MPTMQRPGLAHWMWERGLKPRHAEAQLGVSKQSVRRYCMPFGSVERRVPPEDVLERIVAWTKGAVTAADFYPPHLNGKLDAANAVREVAQ